MSRRACASLPEGCNQHWNRWLSGTLILFRLQGIGIAAYCKMCVDLKRLHNVGTHRYEQRLVRTVCPKQCKYYLPAASSFNSWGDAGGSCRLWLRVVTPALLDGCTVVAVQRCAVKKDTGGIFPVYTIARSVRKCAVRKYKTEQQGGPALDKLPQGDLSHECAGMPPPTWRVGGWVSGGCQAAAMASTGMYFRRTIAMGE